MKIAYLFGSLNRGGLETLMLDVFRNAGKTPFDFVGIHRKGGAYEKDFYATNIPVFHVCPKFKGDIFYFFRLRRLLKRERINIVHAQTALDAVIAHVVTLFTKIKVVTTYHCFCFSTEYLVKYALKCSDTNVFVSKYQKEQYEKVYELKNVDKNCIVYNGVSFDKLGPIAERKSSQATLTLGTVGNFVRGRDQNFICKFLKLLHDKGVDFQFYFVGMRNEQETWHYDDCVNYCNENGLSDCVHFLGGRSDVSQLLQTWDAFIYSTDHDTFGISVVEAIAAALPTFVNDWDVMCEITQNGNLATLYKTKDAPDLCEKFMLFLQDKEAHITQSKKNALEARKLYGINAHIQSLHNIYKEIINSTI